MKHFRYLVVAAAAAALLFALGCTKGEPKLEGHWELKQVVVGDLTYSGDDLGRVDESTLNFRPDHSYQELRVDQQGDSAMIEGVYAFSGDELQLTPDDTTYDAVTMRVKVSGDTLILRRKVSATGDEQERTRTFVRRDTMTQDTME